jgi:hypothetical protein
MTFVPGHVLVTGITQAIPAVVTCSTDHNLTTGQIVRLNIPKAYGMQDLNNRLVQITDLSTTTFSIQERQVPETVNIDSRSFQAFTNAGTGTPAAFVAVGSGPTPLLNTSAQILGAQATTTIDDQTVNNSTSEIPF